MNIKSLSRAITKALRHSPEDFNLTLDANGYAPVKDVLRGGKITFEDLVEIVETNDKQRLAFNEDKTLIRANQGHSVEVDLQLEAVTPPFKLYHGTHAYIVGLISEEGLKKMKRHHVHLADNTTDAHTVGRRSGTAIVFEVDAYSMHMEGHKFYKTPNGVWLTDHVPPHYLKRVK